MPIIIGAGFAHVGVHHHKRGERHAQSLDGTYKDGHRIIAYPVSDGAYGYDVPLTH